MNIWLCPIKARNWKIVKSRKLFGVPKRGLNTFRGVKTGDILAFYVLKPINGIVALGRIKSEVFEDHRDIWGKGRYPFRVKIELMSGFTRKENNPIPLGSFLGKIDSERGIRIEPYLKNVWVTRISHQQYRKLKGLFHTANEI